MRIRIGKLSSQAILARFTSVIEKQHMNSLGDPCKFLFLSFDAAKSGDVPVRPFQAAVDCLTSRNSWLATTSIVASATSQGINNIGPVHGTVLAVLWSPCGRPERLPAGPR